MLLSFTTAQYSEGNLILSFHHLPSEIVLNGTPAKQTYRQIPGARYRMLASLAIGVSSQIMAPAPLGRRGRSWSPVYQYHRIEHQHAIGNTFGLIRYYTSESFPRKELARTAVSWSILCVKKAYCIISAREFVRQSLCVRLWRPSSVSPLSVNCRISITIPSPHTMNVESCREKT